MTTDFPTAVLWWISLGPPATSVGAALYSVNRTRKTARELHQRALNEERGREARALSEEQGRSARALEEERGREARAAATERMTNFRHVHLQALDLARTDEQRHALLDRYARAMIGAVEDPMEMLAQLTARPLAEAQDAGEPEVVDFIVDPVRESARGGPTDLGDTGAGGGGPDPSAAG